MSEKFDFTKVSFNPDALQFDTNQTAARHNTPPNTLRRWRREGIGPRFHRISGNRVLYDRDELDAFFFGSSSTGIATEDGGRE